MMKLLRIITRIYWRYFRSPEAYARHIGVKIGHNCLINTRNWSSEPYLVTIGNHVQITHNVYIHTHGGCNVVRSKCPDFDIFGKVVIEDWAYIGTGSQIMPGVTIGKCALVAAGSIVTRSVPPGVVVGGNPAKILCTIDEYLDRNLRYNIGSKGMSLEDKKKLLLSLPEGKFIKK